MQADFCVIIFCSLLYLISPSTAVDTIDLTQSIRDGESIVSAQGIFELGFFSPGNSGRKYVGIWFNSVPGQTVVWVANRNTPISDSSAILQMTNESVLVLRNSTGVIWRTNTSRSVQNPVAQISDTGNFVVRDQSDNNPDNYLWQSFDYPCDSLLPGMKLGRDLVTGFDRYLTSWKSSDDPSPGSYTYRMDYTSQRYPQPVLRRGSVELYRDGPWNGIWFSGVSLLEPNPSEIYKFVFNNKEMYYMYELVNTSVITYGVLHSYGTLQRLQWDNRTQGWAAFLSKPVDACDSYAVCGSFGVCNLANSPQCQCVSGFVPKSAADSSAGCVRSTPLNCSLNNGFVKYSDVKLPDTSTSWYNTTMTLQECKTECLQNCSCVAYTNLEVTNGGTGCLLWFNDIIDVRVQTGAEQDLYVRVISSNTGDKKKRIWIAVALSLLAALILCAGACFVLRRRNKKKKEEKDRSKSHQVECEMSRTRKEESELPIFAFSMIAQATNDFSFTNKIGEGGFGPVYKGVLNNGQEIAVKRLSKESRQGLNEFKNEALFIAKLQHRNLVKLIGCCVDAEERMLIYEYMPNNSLDKLIFDKESSALLDWPMRFEIIKGVARGLLYLHQDSRLRIVHRDLKASNILLDAEMNPKISDFGMARSFDGSEIEAIQTGRVAGTYGYMPPEYTIDGLFSVKSDVFSFGVLILEIVCGKKNRGFIHPNHNHNLLGHAWMLFRDGTTLDIVDESIWNSEYASELQRSIHIGLLCVQQHPEDRPGMSLVTVMLTSDCELPEPKEPGFFVGRNMPQGLISSDASSCSQDQITVTLLSAR